MFYSQFILAKKGPLGTIWIAAHLERKLRKNQVADTDIGVSVDSILFPDVPIALRLSSHLLLGVVRIYSKKVNYLFHDCSEALLKIKQAFRSTAVDLPPEESTAPYNSITLPETFDLDNFELPDSAFLDSNFVDHHVSTREQITLQDTVNGTTFPTSKFGLDERFGDGDASQIGLELDEELYMDKNSSLQHNEVSLGSKVSGLHVGENSVPSTSMEIDLQVGYVEEKGNKTQNGLSELISNNYDKKSFSNTEDLERDADSSRRRGYNIQTPDLNEVFLPEVRQALSPNIPFTTEEAQTSCVIEPAQAPSTPGLFEEVMPSNSKVPVDSLQENNPGTCVESGRLQGCINSCVEMEYAEEGLTNAELVRKSGETVKGLPTFAPDLISPMPESLALIFSNVDLNTTDGVCFVSGAEKQQSDLIGNTVSDYISTTDHLHDDRKTIVASDFSFETTVVTSPPKEEPANSSICTDNIDVGGALSDRKMTQLNISNGPSGIGNQGHVEDIDSCLTSNISAVCCDSHMRSDGSSLHPQSSVIEGRVVVEPFEMPTRDHSYSFKTPMREELQCLTISSCEVQGDDGSSLHPQSSVIEGRAVVEPSEMSTRDHSYSFKTPLREEFQHLSISSFEVQGDGSSLHPQSTEIEGRAVVEPSMKPTRDNSYSFKTPLREEFQHFSVPSFEVQGDGSSLHPQSMEIEGRAVVEPSKKPTRDNSYSFKIPSREEFQHLSVPSFEVQGDGSSLHLQSSIIEGRAVVESSEMPTRDHSYRFKTPLREEFQHLGVSSFGVQGEGLHYNTGSYSNLVGQQVSAYTPSVITFGANKLDDLSISVPSKTTPSGHLNYSSSGFQEPEKMLASIVNVDLPIYQGMQMGNKGVAESDGSVDRISSQCSRKRPVMDSTTIPQTGSSAKFSGIPRSKRATDYIPDDDDILASILVGRKASSLAMGPIPSVSKASSQKRPRAMSRVGMPRKRKVLVDDSMVLHADAIRQQLINTEDIRRMRKKAPCTRPEIWWIHIGAMEAEMFDRSALTGISEELNSISALKYGRHAPDSRVKIAGEAGPSRVSELVNETGGREIDESNLLGASVVGRDVGSSSIPTSEKMESQDDAAQFDLHVQFEEVLAHPQIEADKEVGANSIMKEASISEIDQSIESLEKHDSKSISAVELSHHLESPNLLNTTDNGLTYGECANIVKVGDDSAALAVISEASVIAENVCNSVDASIMEKEKEENVVDAETLEGSHHLISNEVDTAVEAVNFLQDTVFAGTPLLLEEIVKSAVVVEGDCTVERSLENGERRVIDVTLEEQPNVASFTSSDNCVPSAVGENNFVQELNLDCALDVDGKPIDSGEMPVIDVTLEEPPNVASFTSNDNCVPSAVGENNFVQELNLDCALDVDGKPIDSGVVRDSSDFCSVINDSYTGFLNVDDEPEFDEAENGAPNPEVAQSLENSGWSARTRGVARYLKNLFDEECGHGMKSVAVDRLLAGKTRKEASRMFFETLVLKTRDYIQVEQEKPFEYINVRPRIKLLKSEF